MRAQGAACFRFPIINRRAGSMPAVRTRKEDNYGNQMLDPGLPAGKTGIRCGRRSSFADAHRQHHAVAGRSGSGGGSGVNAEKDVCCIASTQTNAERLMNTAPTLSRDKDRTIVGYNSFCLAGNFVDRNTNQNGSGVREKASFTLNTQDRHAVAWMQAGKMLGVPIASAMIQGSDFGVAFRRTTEIANYAADALEGAAASGNATAQKVLDNSRVQQALSFARRADVAQAQLERLSDLDGYDLSNLTFFPTAGDAALTRQNLTMLENLRDHQQEVEVPSITGDNGTNSGSGQPGGTGGYQRSYTSSSGNTYVYAPNFIIYGSMDANDLRSLLDEGYEKFCEYVERYEREKRRTQYGT